MIILSNQPWVFTLRRHQLMWNRLLSCVLAYTCIVGAVFADDGYNDGPMASELGRQSHVEQLKHALAEKPIDAKSIVLEFQLGTALAFRNRAKPDRTVESLREFEHIVSTYKHETYYTSDPDESAESPEFMVPRACILAALYSDGPLEGRCGWCV